MENRPSEGGLLAGTELDLVDEAEAKVGSILAGHGWVEVFLKPAEIGEGNVGDVLSFVFAEC